ncbi:MAG: hypothetical protein COV47_02630 [Candidatus Diapherotrites archaeon CG11_big_fil_rev_8_21_14_0_20_37_9]|nr:MAG: hypothetical protein COV47_02630 [Candidatus Diapherotrites archaeon CG11_big_fil_rev_8_21_14_0_20_37_9]
MKIFFPHDSVRPQQSELINDIVKALHEGKTLVANAPTGIGKTASSIAPALSFAIQNNLKVFFLTPKSSQHEIAIQTVKMMNEKFGLKIKAIDLVGKGKMCIHPLVSHVGAGFYEACNSAKKSGKCVFYSNTKGSTKKQKADALKRKSDVLTQYGNSYDKIKNACFVKELCPYEVTIEMIRGANLVICDYFHIFNDEIRQGILGQAGITLGECILIVDEAHNLPKRVRDMLSTTLKAEDLKKAQDEAKTIADEDAMKALDEIILEFSSLVNNIPFGEAEAVLDPDSILPLRLLAKKKLDLLEDAASVFMNKINKENSFLLASAVFLHTLCQQKKHTLHMVERQKNSLRVSIYPLDPSELTADVFKKSASAVLMSGTLTPLDMYADILGIEDFVLKEYTSPFPKENCLNLFVDRTTTKYTERNSAQYDEIASIITMTTAIVPGNSIVFFPSFEILKVIEPRLGIGRKVLIQEKLMSQEKKSRLVSDFKALGRGFGGVLLAVSGGSIAEGVDFPGENLRCAIIVGIPFAKVSFQSKALIDFYEKKFHKGWDYAYNAPAINRAVQAAGRVIRTESDRGVCIFLDKRFSEPMYKKFFPKNFSAITTGSPEELVKKFKF